jgi:site-specific DNA recombinase
MGRYSLKAIVKAAADFGIVHHRSGKPLGKSEIHRILHNPIYVGEFIWNGKMYTGKHTPIVSKGTYDRVQQVFASSNRPHMTKRRFAFGGLLTCGLCGCAVTAELKKQKCVYYHCTGYKGKCGNAAIREDRLAELLGALVQAVKIPQEQADKIAEALQESH